MYMYIHLPFSYRFVNFGKYVNTYTSVQMYVNVYLFVYTYVHMNMNINEFLQNISICIYEHVFTQIFTCMSIYVDEMYIHTHVHIRICKCNLFVYICIYTYIYI